MTARVWEVSERVSSDLATVIDNLEVGSNVSRVKLEKVDIVDLEASPHTYIQ